MITLVDGDLFETKTGLICHQCNCQGTMETGVGLQVKTRYPAVFAAYRRAFEQGKLRLGEVVFAPNQNGAVVANLCGQEHAVLDGTVYTHYDSLQLCFDRVRDFAAHHHIHTIAFPYLMGCHKGGGNWETVLHMITETFPAFQVEIRRRQEEK